MVAKVDLVPPVNSLVGERSQAYSAVVSLLVLVDLLVVQTAKEMVWRRKVVVFAQAEVEAETRTGHRLVDNLDIQGLRHLDMVDLERHTVADKHTVGRQQQFLLFGPLQLSSGIQLGDTATVVPGNSQLARAYCITG